MIADDDLVYVDNVQEIVCDAFRKNVQWDIIAFQVHGIEREFKKYSKRKMNVGYLKSMKLSSVQLALRNKVKKSGIKFDERFGAGSMYNSGEENIFLFDCLKSGLKIGYVPIKIADLHLGSSSWFHGFDANYFFTLGSYYCRMFGIRLAKIMIVQFIVRHYNLFNKQISAFYAFRKAIEGIENFKNNMNQSIT